MVRSPDRATEPTGGLPSREETLDQGRCGSRGCSENTRFASNLLSAATPLAQGAANRGMSQSVVIQRYSDHMLARYRVPGTCRTPLWVNIIPGRLGEILISRDLYITQAGIISIILVMGSIACVHPASAADWPIRDSFIARPSDSFEISTDFVSPHINWDCPSAHGTQRVLVLPYSQALSQREAQQIAAFVQRGGLLVADVRAGTCDGYGKRMATGQLDDVFAVRWNGFDSPDGPDPVSVAGRVGEIGIDDVLHDTQVDRSLRINGAAARMHADDGTPLVTVNRFGRGTAVLLNFMSDYHRPTYYQWTVEPIIRGRDRADVFCEIIAAVFQQHGIEPEVIVTQGGERARTIQLAAFGDDDGIAIYGTVVNADAGDLMPIYEHRRDLVYRFPRQGHVYDVRHGTYLGQTDTVRTDLEPGGARIWAVMEYRVALLQIDAPAVVRPGSELIVHAQIVPYDASKTPGMHVFRVTLTGRPATATLREQRYSAERSSPRNGAFFPQRRHR